MTYLSLLARRIFRPLRPPYVLQLRTRIPFFLVIIALVLAQPLLVSAKSPVREQSQLAGIAQATPTQEEESPEEVATDQAGSEELTEEETPQGDQVNIEFPAASATDVITVEIPFAEQNDEQTGTDNVIPIPFAWQGDTTVNARALGEAVPPLQAEVLQGDFQVSFVAAEATTGTEDVLRILPLAAPGILRLGLKLDASSSMLPFPAGQTLQLQLTARIYAPEANARLTIADNLGSSSVTLEGLNWSDYQVIRQIDASATSMELMLEWSNVPANGWLEMRGLSVALVSAEEVALSPTDTPRLIEEVTIEPTAPLPPTSTPTPPVAATPFPTATPLPDIVNTPKAGIAETADIANATILTPTPTFIVVTSTPTPEDVYQEATRVAQATDWARILGPATPTPPNLATPTPTFTPYVVIVVNTPTPGNAATATQVALYATAVAFTTGTPTPIPADATIAVATATVPKPTNTPRPSRTPTPVFVLLDDIPVSVPGPTAVVPTILYNKIIFLTDYRGDPRRPNSMIMNPDGSDVALMTNNTFYWRSAAQDYYSADKRYRVYNQREWGGEAHNAGRIQLFYDDYFYNSLGHQLTYFGAGVSWQPAWSPTSETIAFVSSESGNDEIWVMQRGVWPATQLTKNDWEWDHHPSFSPDGSEIVFSSNRVTGNQQIWIMSSSGENQRQLTNFTSFEAWDPIWIKYVGLGSDECNPNYPDICVPTGEEILTCSDITESSFPVLGEDPYGFDQNGDGIGCEPGVD